MRTVLASTKKPAQQGEGGCISPLEHCHYACLTKDICIQYSFARLLAANQAHWKRPMAAASWLVLVSESVLKFPL